MTTLDEITNEKKRITQVLARVDAQRERLADQLEELRAAERALARYSKTGQRKRTSARTKSATSARAARNLRAARATTPGGKPTSLSLSDQVLTLATGKTQQEITAVCKSARPNHVGVAIARHKRAGRLEERDGKLYATQ